MPKPGPGTYNIKTTIGQGPAVTMGSRLDGKTSAEFVPGPGSYNIPSAIGTGRQHQYTMRTRTKLIEPGMDSPGPGAYAIRPESPSKAYSLSARPKEIQTTLTFPGPGHYNDNVVPVTSRAPAYTMRGRPNTPPNKFNTPGPGAYDNRNLSPSKAASLKSRHATNFGPQTPGPGAYNLPSAFTGPSFTMRPKTKLPKADD